MQQSRADVNRQRLLIGGVWFVGYVVCIFGANWAIQNLGRAPVAPGAPHTVPVWPSTGPTRPEIWAPSGVLFVGFAFAARDMTQEWLGRKAAILAILIGAGCSFLVAPAALAIASGGTFLISEFADFLVYTPLRTRRWWLAVLL